MDEELKHEKIAHLKTRLALYQTQGQLLAAMAQQANAELDELEAPGMVPATATIPGVQSSSPQSSMQKK